MDSLRENYARQLENELDLLRQERDQNSMQIAPSRAIPDNVIGTVADGLDTCIQQKSEVLHSVQLQMQPLVEEQRFLHGRHRHLASQISPHILPEELLAEIFTWARTNQLYTDYHDIPFPYVASWVSSRWRTVAIGNPILWRDVHISNDHSVDLVKTQIERSKTCALAIMLSISHSPYYFPSSADNDYWEDRLQGIMNILMACSDRWYSFQLCESSRGNDFPSGLKNIGVIFNSLRKLSAPHLKCLRVRWPGPMYGEPLFMGGAPMLSRIELRNVNVRSNLPLLSGITHLTLAAIPFSRLLTELEFRNVLEACPLLTYLASEQQSFILDSKTGHSVINIPSLRSLTVSFYGDDFDGAWISGLFNRLSMAGLQSLRLHFLWDSYKYFISVMQLIPPSSRYPALSKLSLCTADYLSPFFASSDFAQELLLLFPHIEHLELDFANKEIWNILQVLASCTEESGQPLCPRLRTLDCTLYVCSEEDIQRLKCYISKRASTGYPITTLRIQRAHLRLEYTDVYGCLETFRDCVSVEYYDGRDSWTDFPLMI